MIRNLGLTILTFALMVAFLSAAGDDAAPDKGDNEPAKKQPADPAAKNAKKDAKQDAKPGDEPMPDAKPESPEEIIKRLRDEFDDAGTKLEKRDPGDKTRSVQKQIIDDLDKLINQKNNQNSNSSSSSSSSSDSSSSDSSSSNSDSSNSKSNGQPKPMGGNQKDPSQGGGKSKPKGGQDQKDQGAKGNQDQKKDGKGQDKKDQSAKGNDQKNGKNGKSGGGTEAKKGYKKIESNKNADLYREAWGHLPEKKRQEIDVYAGDHTMDKYEQFQLRYTGKVLEQRRKKEGE